jgi:hypothetical protein
LGWWVIDQSNLIIDLIPKNKFLNENEYQTE